LRCRGLGKQTTSAAGILLAVVLGAGVARPALVVQPVGGTSLEIRTGETLTLEVFFDIETVCCATFTLELQGVPEFATVARAEATGTLFDSAEVAFIEVDGARVNFVGSVTVGGLDQPKAGEFDLVGIAPGAVQISLREDFEILDAEERPVPIEFLPTEVRIVPEPDLLLFLSASLLGMACVRRRSSR
jgi:hypothetical protein